MIDYLTNKNKFVDLLRSTRRAGIENVICKLDELGFFTAPASASHHLNEIGGLVQHSLNVYELALRIRSELLLIRSELVISLPEDSVILASLLHDVCKADIYIPAVKKRKTPMGYWQEYNGYDVDYSGLPVGHGEKSVIRLLQWGLSLTDHEILAIRWHMSAWDMAFQSYEARECLNDASAQCPLLKIIQAADGLAAGVLE